MDDAIVRYELEMVWGEITAFLEFTPKCYFAGGALASIVLGESPKDYDMWFENIDDWNTVWAKLINPNVSENMDRVKLSQFAATVTLPSGKVVQFVRNRLGKPLELVPTFDFLHTHSYYDPATLDLSINIPFIKSRSLQLVGNLDHPINTLERIIKFTKRGYFAPPEMLVKFMLEINKLDPEKIKDTKTAVVFY